GRRMVDWVVAAARALDADPLVVVTSPQGVAQFDGIETAVQAEPRGTGDALAAARQAFGDVAGDLLVLSGDAPVVSPNLLRELLALVEDGDHVAAYVAPDPVEAEGVNTRAELAAAGAALRDRINHEHMLAGVTIVDPQTTWIEPEVEIEPDAEIHPFTVVRGK